MSTLRILILTDGRAGHVNLSNGIAAAIGRRRPADVVRLDVRRGRWPGQALAVATAAGVSPEIVLSRVYGIDPAGLPRADLVISAGAETLAANVAMARLIAVPNIFYGSLRWFRARDFALVLTSYAEDVRVDNRRMTLKPCRIDPDALPVMARPHGAPPRTAALLVGGSTTGIDYRADDWSRLLAFIATSHEAHATRWLVSNSRRTPESFGDAIAALARNAAGPVARFVDVREPGAPGLGEILAGAEAVVCTADSSSMLSEVVWMRRPVLAVSPARFRLERREQTYRRHFADNGWSRTLPLALLSPETFVAALGQITPYPGNAADDLAMLLGHALPDLFAGAAGA